MSDFMGYDWLYEPIKPPKMSPLLEYQIFTRPQLNLPTPSIASMAKLLADFEPPPRRMEILVRPDPMRTVATQARTHRRKRIDKKWRKRYGYTYSKVLDTAAVGNVFKMEMGDYDLFVYHETAYRAWEERMDKDTDGLWRDGIPVRRSAF